MANLLSFLIPLYNEENRVNSIFDFYKQINNLFNFDIEIICILNGCTDNTKKVLQSNINNKNIKIISIDKRSRGTAIKIGIENSSSDLIAIASVDNAWDISFYKKSYDSLINDKNLSIVYGPKSHLKSIVKRPLIRKIISFFCKIYLKILFGKLFNEDTQCIKMFKKKDITYIDELSDSNYFTEAEFFFYSKIYTLKIKFLSVEIKDTKKRIKIKLLLAFIYDALKFRIKIRKLM